MKSSIPFDTTSPHATIIVKTDKADFYRTNMLQPFSVVENEPREDGTTVFIVNDLDLNGIWYFMKQPDTHVHYYELMRGNAVRVCVWMHKNDFVDSITLSINYGLDKEGNQKWGGEITVRSGLNNILDNSPSGYEINWPGIGSSSIERAKLFTLSLETAATLAEECTTKYVKK